MASYWFRFRTLDVRLYQHIVIIFFRFTSKVGPNDNMAPPSRDGAMAPFPPPPAAASANPHSRVIRDSLLLQCLGNCDMLTNSWKEKKLMMDECIAYT